MDGESNLCTQNVHFRDQYEFDPDHLNKVRDICIFLLTLYAKTWFGCTDGIATVNQDLQLIKDGFVYKAISDTVLDTIFKPLAMAFFDPAISTDVKRKMAKNLSLPPWRMEKNEKRVKLLSVKRLEFESYVLKDVGSFVTKKSLRFFERFGISIFDRILGIRSFDMAVTSKLQVSRRILSWLTLVNVNDTAERDVKLMTEYNSI